MFSVRRSARIADKERQKFIDNLNSDIRTEEPKKASDNPTKKKKKNNDVVKMSIDGGNVRKKIVKPKKTKSRKNSKNKFVDLETTKMNDVFPLIKKYSRSETEQNEKYHLLKTVIKYRKEMNINNLVVDLYKHKAVIEVSVYKHLQIDGYTLITIGNHLSDILSYKEIDDVDSIISSKDANQDTYNYRDCDNLVNSLSVMRIHKSEKEIAEEQIRKDLDEIEKLNSMICRLMR